ncbi:hypothetical protein HNR33_004279 [Brassicibacter mesophilus]
MEQGRLTQSSGVFEIRKLKELLGWIKKLINGEPLEE